MKDFLDRSEIINVLAGFNPWWSERRYELPPFRRLAFDACRRYLEDSTLRRAVLAHQGRPVDGVGGSVSRMMRQTSS